MPNGGFWQQGRVALGPRARDLHFECHRDYREPDGCCRATRAQLTGRTRPRYDPEFPGIHVAPKREALYCLRMRQIWTRRALIATAALLPGRAFAQDADDLLYNRVLRKLNNDRSLRIRDLTVTVVQGVVTINGVVRTERLKQRAKKVASVKGVKKVVNELRIGA